MSTKKKINIFFVEDDIIFQTQLADYLEIAGFDVTRCIPTYENAIKELQKSQNKFDLLLLDCQLPTTEDQYKETVKDKKELDTLRTRYKWSGSKLEIKDNKVKDEVENAGERRNMILKNIALRKKKDNGIKICNEWFKYLNENTVSTSNDKREIPVIFFSAYNLDEHKESVKNLVKEDWVIKPKIIWLEKPIEVEELIQSIEKVLN